MAYQDFAGKRRPSSSAYPEKSSGYVTVDDPITGTGKFQIDNLIGSVAPIFDSTVNYTAGQSVMYGGKLYTFNVDHPAGTWNANHVSATIVVSAPDYFTSAGDVHPYVMWRGSKTAVKEIGDSSETYDSAKILVDARAYGGTIRANFFGKATDVADIKNRMYKKSSFGVSLTVSSSRQFLKQIAIPANTKFKIKVTAGTAIFTSIDITPSQDENANNLVGLVGGTEYSADYPYDVEAIYYTLDAGATAGTATLEIECFPAETMPSSIKNSDFGTEGKNLFNLSNPDNSIGFYVHTSNGALWSNPSYNATAFIPVEEGVTYYRNYVHNFAWYNFKKTFISSGNSGSSITAPSGAKYVRLTVDKYAFDGFVLSKEPINGYTPFGWNVLQSCNNEIDRNLASFLSKTSSSMGAPTIKATASTLASGASLTIDDFPQNIKKGLIFNLSLNPANFSAITFGTGSISDYESAYVSVDTTNIVFKYKGAGGEMTLGTYAHGLTISTFLRIDSSVNNDGEWQVVLSTLGGAYKCSKYQNFSNRGKPFIRNDGTSALSDVVAVVGNKDLRSSVWVFGDSYLGLADDVRSPYWLREWGYKNGMFCGFPGAKSSDILPSLYYALKLGQPKYVVWMLGMNDTYAQWSEYIGIVKSLCAYYCVELIIATIPPVPSRLDNVDKNNDIISWNYRYIDQASAVGANSSGVWYAGLLASDYVHPSELGAKAIASQILIDFPEIAEL